MPRTATTAATAAAHARHLVCRSQGAAVRHPVHAVDDVYRRHLCGVTRHLHAAVMGKVAAEAFAAVDAVAAAVSVVVAGIRVAAINLTPPEHRPRRATRLGPSPPKMATDVPPPPGNRSPQRR